MLKLVETDLPEFIPTKGLVEAYEAIRVAQQRFDAAATAMALGDSEVVDAVGNVNREQAQLLDTLATFGAHVVTAIANEHERYSL